ncbi:MAG: DUF2635 domain-containing protein [Afipia sp.]|nr:DUF2635 domain-containing protein [Afipia sp.]
MSNLFLKPSKDGEGKPVLVRDPIDMKPLDSGGEWKEASTYWRRRIRDGDVLDATAEKVKLAKKEEPGHAPRP